MGALMLWLGHSKILKFPLANLPLGSSKLMTWFLVSTIVQVGKIIIVLVTISHKSFF